MLPGMELAACTGLAVPANVMHHVVQVESSFNPYAIGVVDGRLARQPRSLPEAVATARMLESRGFNFSLGLAQVNRYNLDKYGLGSYEQAFATCPNLRAGARILAECRGRSKGDWGKAFSCYYSGNFETGFRHGYVRRIYASMGQVAAANPAAIPVIPTGPRAQPGPKRAAAPRAPVATPAWHQRTETVTRTQPVNAPVPPTMPRTEPPLRTVEGEVAVLDAAGGPARLVPAPPTRPAAEPAPTATPSDTAFVF